MQSRVRLSAFRPVVIAVAVGACGLYAVANLVLVTARWEFDDIQAYLGAAQRLLAGDRLYLVTADPSEIYRYAPWFAFAWIPLSFLPRMALEVGWAAVLVGATVAAILPFRRSWSGIALALLLGGLLYRTAGWGNVQPLLVAALVYGLPTRAGPWLLGVAASLKPWPILGIAVYAWRGQWRAAVISIGVAAVLWLPVLLFNWADNPGNLRVPTIWDASFLLAVPALVRATRRTNLVAS